nr:putative ribonuclease H-like domain-containing protein [Tanacetum cinerariifolium]
MAASTPKLTVKGKQHRASCKIKPVSSVDQPLFRLHMNLFRPTFVNSLNKKSCCLVITDDFSRFTWVFFLATKDETTPILKTFLTGLENQLSLKVKVIRSDNGTEFKNSDLNQFCGLKRIKSEFSVPRTPKQNGIAERKNYTLIEAARTMLADSLSPILFWAEAVNTACYVQNRVLVTKPHNKTPYEILHGRTPIHAGNQTNSSAGFQDNFDSKKAGEEVDQSYMLFLMRSVGSTNPQNNAEDAAFDRKEHDFDVKKPESKVILSLSSSAQSKEQDDKTKKEAKGKSPVGSVMGYRDLNAEFQDCFKNSSNEVNAASSTVPTIGKIPLAALILLVLLDIIYSDDEDVVGAEADFNNLESSIPVTYASFIGFMVYQMDVKSAFLYGTIEEEVYVCQPSVFEDPDHPDKVFKVVKALYGLHQAPRAWYETLATFLLDNGSQRGTIDQTLFIKKQKGDILLVQIYVDDIIFGATNKDLCRSFEKLMKDKFQMSSIGELTFFLGIQVKQKKDGIFINQDKYVAEILRKFGLTEGKSASTPIDTEKPLLKDPDGENVDVHTYRSMIGSLMYLTSSRPDIMFAVYACLWYPKDSPFDLVAYSDSDYVGASLDRKSTTRECQFLGCRLISWQCKKQTVVATSSTEAEYVVAASCYA